MARAVTPRVASSQNAETLAVPRIGLRRDVHPWAWWAWAIGAAVAVSLSRNPLLLVLVSASVVAVVLARRSAAPWARSVRGYLIAAAVVIGIRLVFQVLVGGLRSGRVLFRLPEIPLPAWAAGVQLGGPVTVDGLLYTITDAGRLAGMLICVGAANALANPKRALRNVPAALHEISTAVVIALALAPQLIESVQRVRRARRLRGGRSTGWHALNAVVVPVLEDAIDRSIALATSMESRGYGRTRDDARVGRGTSAILLAAMCAIVLAGLGLLGVPDAAGWAVPLLVAGVLASWWGLRRSGRRLRVSRYRPDAWHAAEWLCLGCGLAATLLAALLARIAPDAMAPPVSPAAWPRLHPLMLVLALVVLAPGVLTPRPEAA